MNVRRVEVTVCITWGGGRGIRFCDKYTVEWKRLIATKTYIFLHISNKMQLYTVYLYLQTALHVSGGTSTHHQESIQLYLQR